MATEEKQEANALSAPSAGGGNKMVLILTVVNLVATVGMVGILFYSFQKDKKTARVEDISPQATHEESAEAPGGHGGGSSTKEANAKKAVDLGRMVTLEQFTVNLSTPGSVSPKFVRVNISIEVPTEDAETEI